MKLEPAFFFFPLFNWIDTGVLSLDCGFESYRGDQLRVAFWRVLPTRKMLLTFYWPVGGMAYAALSKGVTFLGSSPRQATNNATIAQW